MLSLLAVETKVYSQTSHGNYYKSIKSFDLSKIWLPGIIQLEDSKLIIQPIGFIGGDYQRFYIHYTSIIKDVSNPYKYIVRGKTKVGNKIRAFTGSIVIINAELSKESEDPRFKQGRVICTVDIKEDKNQSLTGYIKGTLITDWCLDKNRQISYDALTSYSDSFNNNECKAIWTDYKIGKSLNCNWGDFRIPDSGNLDEGAGQFSVNKKYLKNGWITYMQMIRQNKKAALIENSKWW